MNMEDKTWDVLDSYFKSDKNFLTKHHLESFNDFVYTKIPNTVKSLNPFVTLKNDKTSGKLKHRIEIYVGGKDGDELYFQKPTVEVKTEVDDKKRSEKRLLVPNEARLKNLTYKSDLLCNILVKYITYDENEQVDASKYKETIFNDMKIGTIPVMLHSKLCILHDQPDSVLKEFGECIYDRGGYMIVDGKEKVIVAQERIATNRLFLNRSKDKDYQYEGLIRCTTEEAAIFPKTLNVGVYSDQYLKGQRKNSIVMTLPNIKREIPIFILFRALGIESDKHILEHIVYDIKDPENARMMEFLWYSMRDGSFLYTQDQALEFLMHYVKLENHENVDHVKYIIMNDLFPNMNEGSGKDTRVSLTKKALFLGHVTYNIVKTCLGLKGESDRDNYAFKRVDLSGFLLANLFRDYYNMFRNETRSIVDRKYNYGGWNKLNDLSQLINDTNKYEIFDGNIVENGLMRSLKGQWGRPDPPKPGKKSPPVKVDLSKAGNVQDLSRISYIGFLSHLRRVNTPVDRSIKIVAPHRLHPTQWGYMCPCESPDGASIGLLKNFAMLCHVSFDCSSREIVKCLKDLSILEVQKPSVSHGGATVIGGALQYRRVPLVRMLEYIVPSDYTDDVVKVLVNSNWIGLTAFPEKVVKMLRLLRRNTMINVMTSVSWDIVAKEININTEAGRCCRPLYIVEDNKLRIKSWQINQLTRKEMSWHDLVNGNSRVLYDATDCTYYDPFNHFKKDKTVKEDVEFVWDELKKNQGVVEFIDVEESNTCMIAMEFKDLVRTQDSKLPRQNPNEAVQVPIQTRFTHCEIHPSTIFAVMTANIPFADHNQAPRNYFSGQQGKQSISVYNTAFNSRMDIMAMVLHYSQKSLCNTRYMHYLGNNDLPHGTNTIVAIMTYTGLTLC